LVDPGTFEPVSENHTGPVLLIVAAQVGGVRLIDNHSFEI
jgi:pantoate--beta-alanine ligase